MESAAALSRRAERVRALAGRLDHSGLRAVPAFAGPDTWRGPLAEGFEVRLLDALTRLDDAVAELRGVAAHLDAQALSAAALELAEGS